MAFICDVVLFGVFSDKTVSLRTFHQGQIISFVRLRDSQDNLCQELLYKVVLMYFSESGTW